MCPVARCAARVMARDGPPTAELTVHLATRRPTGETLGFRLRRSSGRLDKPDSGLVSRARARRVGGAGEGLPRGWCWAGRKIAALMSLERRASNGA